MTHVADVDKAGAGQTQTGEMEEPSHLFVFIHESDLWQYGDGIYADPITSSIRWIRWRNNTNVGISARETTQLNSNAR